MSSLRNREPAGYTVVPNQVLEDPKLSYRAKGVLVWLLAKPDGWDVRSEVIAAASPSEGREAIRTALRELRARGYYRLSTEQSESGTWQQVTEVWRTPQPHVAAEYAEELRAKPLKSAPTPKGSAKPRGGAAQAKKKKRAAAGDGNPGAGAGDVVPAGKEASGDGFSGPGPGDGFPDAGSPGAGFPGALVSTQSKYSEIEPPGDARRATNVSTGPRPGGCAADKPKQHGGVKPAAMRRILDGIPAELRDRLPSPLPTDVTAAISSALEDWSPGEVATRIGRRWDAYGYGLAEVRAAGGHGEGVRSPVGVLLTLLEQRCPERTCDDGVLVHNDRPCPRCEERREDHVRAHPDRFSRAEGPGAPEQVPARPTRAPVAAWPLCADCRAPMDGVSPDGFCVECRPA